MWVELCLRHTLVRRLSCADHELTYGRDTVSQSVQYGSVYANGELDSIFFEVLYEES